MRIKNHAGLNKADGGSTMRQEASNNKIAEIRNETSPMRKECTETRLPEGNLKQS